MLFARAVRPEFALIHKDASVIELSRLLGARWKEMTGDEKKPFEELAAKVGICSSGSFDDIHMERCCFPWGNHASRLTFFFFYCFYHPRIVFVMNARRLNSS